MKKILPIILILILSVGMLAGCNTQTGNINDEKSTKVISPLAETLDINALDNCTVAVSLKKGDAKLSDGGKMVMDLTVYSYEVYDKDDIESLNENDVIVRKNEKVTITELKWIDDGFLSINGGEENGGFDLASFDNNVYYEIGVNDIKSYYELGKVTLPVSDEFEYIDESDLAKQAKVYYPGDFLTDDGDIEYNFYPNNTSVVIEDGTVVKMYKFFTP